MKVLLLEDEAPMADLIHDVSVRNGYVVDVVGCLADVESATAVSQYALFILDRRVPDGDGMSLIPGLRRRHPGVPVLMLTALDTVAERVQALDQGADDYLVKPFEADELMARVHALLRRRTAADLPPVRCGRLVYSAASREFTIEGEPILLNRQELSILEMLITRARRVVLRSVLIEYTYGFADDIQSNTLDAHGSEASWSQARPGLRFIRCVDSATCWMR